MTSKSEMMYCEFMRILKNLATKYHITLSPTYLIIDMEIAVSNACKLAFPDTQIGFCYFHFTKVIYGILIQYGKGKHSDTCLDFAKKLKRIQSLAFLPPQYVPEAVKLLNEENKKIRHTDNIEYEAYNHVFKHLENNYMESGRFPISSWSCYGREKFNCPTTTNFVENWHAKLNNILKQKEGLYSTIDALKTYNHETSVKAFDLNINPKAAKSTKITTKIRKVADKINKRKILNTVNYIADILINVE